MNKNILSFVCLFAATAGHAQSRIVPDTRNLTLQVGTFTFDRGGDASTTAVALRANRPLGRYLLAEGGLMGARVGHALFNGSQIPVDRHARATLAGLDLGVQAQLPTPFAQPYIGIATGFFGYFEGGDGTKFLRPSQQALGGVRFAVGGHLGLRAELRARFDQFSDGGSSNNIEQTVGISWRW